MPLVQLRNPSLLAVGGGGGNGGNGGGNGGNGNGNGGGNGGNGGGNGGGGNGGGGGGGLSGGAIAGAVVGSVLGAVLIVGVIAGAAFLAHKKFGGEDKYSRGNSGTRSSLSKTVRNFLGRNSNDVGSSAHASITTRAN